MLSRLFRKRQPPIEFQPVQPETVIEIVGDVHGTAHLLRALPPVEDGATRVFVGDLVDRGMQSHETLEIVFEGCRNGEWICLKGNHEEMFLQFLSDPSKGRNWLRFGGLQTIASFDLGGITETSSPEALEDIASAIRDRLTPGLLDWLENLPHVWISNNLAIAHAGLDPKLPISLQKEQVALWGHPEFAKTPRRDGQWVAHGHTIVDTPTIRNGVISVDTGAYATNLLTLARISPDGQIEFSYAPRK
ncbi:metallophosphoesterase [Aliiruegeria lutimaris]|uniref:Serine/threonine protein phosphatase 1 n=1 Tax=Aliiruegeria lutimaris TaxID=571298 RepID=A0A1G9AQM4_9RHOB|nr:metallophosphoesterase [Aliiruegeria lutimaris]SDK29134.1 serine/threonine protein phosphatase 1 [Aliiruegeria lutimaris]